MLLLIEFVAASAAGHKAENAMARKDKKKLPIPVRSVSLNTRLPVCPPRYNSSASGDTDPQKYPISH
jgi:hypothetical protein